MNILTPTEISECFTGGRTLYATPQAAAQFKGHEMSKDLLVLADEYAAATATFARALALKDEADSMSPIAREAGDKRAVLAEALAALDTAQPVQMNEWKDAVIDALVVAHILTPENAIYPRKAVQDVIDWNCQVALDPRVSLKAQALVDSGEVVQVNAMLVEALQAAEKLEHEALVALSEATYELKVGNTYTTATDTYKAHNDLIHRLDKILNSQYRDRKRAALTAAQQAQPERAPLSDAEITQLMNDWGVVTTKHRTDKGEPFQSVELSFDRLSALLHAAHGIKQGGQHD